LSQTKAIFENVLTKEGVFRVLGNSQKAVFWTIIVGFENLLDCCVPNSSGSLPERHNR